MPRIKSGAVLRQDLGQVAYGYAAEASLAGFIGLQIMPIFETAVQTANYPVITAESLLSLPDTKRASRSAYGRSDYEFDDGTFVCKEHGWEEPVGDDEAALFRSFFDAEVVAVQRATQILLRNQEKRIADKLTGLSATNVSKKWSDATATIRSDVRAGKDAMFAATGLKPNALIVSQTTFDNILVSQGFGEATKYTSPALLEVFEIQKKLVAQYLGISQVLVGDAVYNGAKKGQAFSATTIWPNAKGVLARVATEPQNLKEACIGRTFLWTEDSPQNLVTEQYREDQTRSDVYRVRHNVDEAFVFQGAAYVLGNLA